MNEYLTNLDSKRAVYSILGILCNKPQIIRDPDMPINENDFFHRFHKNIFAAINNIAYSDYNVEKISAVDIDNYLAQFPANYKIWEQHQGFEYMSAAIENANETTYKLNYWRLKKFSMLRDYLSKGIDVVDIYDYKIEDLKKQEEQMKKLDKMTISQIVEHFSLKMLDLKTKWSIGDRRKAFMAGDGLDELIEKLKKDPEFGYPFANGYYNSLFRGMRMKKFMLRSAGTGVGKTRLSLADLTDIACSHIFDPDKKEYVENGEVHPVLFISTELEQDELQTAMIAHVANIDEDIIKNGRYSKEIEERLNIAIAIIKSAPFYIEYIDDFSINDIETVIERYIIEHNIKYLGFDYIQIVPKLARTMQENFGGTLREDQILVQFSAALKTLVNRYDVFLISATQLNRNSKEHEMRDPTSLRGGMATADKVDHGVMVFRTTQRDLDNLDHILKNMYGPKPNFCHYIYKNRGGKTGFIIWSLYDAGVIREKPLFITDMDYNHISNIQQIKVEFNEEVEPTPEEIERHNNFVDEHMEEDESKFVDAAESEIPEF